MTLTGTYIYSWISICFVSAFLSEKQMYFLPCWGNDGACTVLLPPSPSWWCCLQKGPNQIPPPWSTNKNCIHNSMNLISQRHLRKNEFMTSLRITSQKLRDVNSKPSSTEEAAFFYSPQDARERHNVFFSLRLLYFCSSFLQLKYMHICTDKPCCSSC